MKENSHPKPKEIMFMFRQGGNLLFPMIRLMINDKVKEIQNGL